MGNTFYFALWKQYESGADGISLPRRGGDMPGALEGYELLFRANMSGRGVATIAPKEGSSVQGVLWNITP